MIKIESLINREFTAVSQNETVGNAIDFLRKQKTDFQSKFAYIYVVDDDKKLKGVLQMHGLLLEDPSREINTIMNQFIASLPETAPLEKVIDLFNSNSFLAIPVIDSNHRLTGTISRKKLESQLSKTDLAKLRRLSSNETEEVEGNSVIEMALKRLPWLLISVTSGLVCSYILGIFIGKIESVVALILFVPIILGLAGNVGTQSARITSRGLKTGKLSVKKLISVLGKEMILGLIIGFCSFLLIAAIAFFWKRYPIEGIALGLSIMAVSAASGLMGIILPITFQTFRISSNSVSRLFLLLTCDIVALILYFVISLSLVSPTLVIS